MRVVLAAFGSRGDVQPMIALGRRMRADGHDVVVGASEGFGGLVRDHGLEFRTIGQDIESWIRSQGRFVADPTRVLRPAIDYLRRDVEVSFEQTREAAQGADLLVSGIHAAAPSVAEALGLPYRTLLFCPQMIRSRHHPPPGPPWFELPGVVNGLLWHLCSVAFGVALRNAINRCRRRWDLAPIDEVLGYLVTDRAILASDSPLGEPPLDAPATVIQTGSLTIASSEALDPELERFLSDGERPAYVGFGSMPDGDARDTTRSIVQALAACGLRGVIASGWAGLGEDTPASIHVVPSVAHAELLPHVALAVHHGGAGTTVAAARAGVPQIVVPHLVDQHYWGHQVYERGLGARPIPRSRLSAKRLEQAIRYVLSSPSIANRAREIKTKLDGTCGVSRLVEILYRDLPELRGSLRAA